MGVAAGLALILISLLIARLRLRKVVAAEGWAISFGILGVILAVLGGLMSTTWPLTVNQPINIMFGEPSMFFGLLLIGASIFLWSRRSVIADLGSSDKKVADKAFDYLLDVLKPVSWVVFGLGLALAACSIAIFRFTIVGAAPPEEPISGLLHNYPLIENTFFGIIYALPAVGALLAPLMVRGKLSGGFTKLAVWCLLLGGIAFLLFSAMNFYTHMGLLVNLVKGDNFEF